MAFGMGESLSVRINAATSDFERGMEAAQDGLNSVRNAATTTAGSLNILGNRADESGDEVSSLGRAAATTSGTLSALSGSATASSTSLAALSAVTTASVVPAIVTLTAVATPIVATLGGIAAAAGSVVAAFGAIIGTGILAFGRERGRQNKERLQEVNAQIERLEALQDTEDGLTQSQQNQLETLKEQQDTLEDQTGVMGGLESAMADLRDELVPIIADFGERFIPLIERTIAVLPSLVESIIAAIGPTESFVNRLLELGGIAQSAIPNLVGGLFDLAREALPIFINVVKEAGNVAGPAFGTIMDTTREMAPILVDLGQSVLDLLPKLLEFGTIAAGVVVPALTTLADALGTALDWVNSLDKSTRRLVAAISLGAPAVGALTAKLFAINPILGLVAGAVSALYLAWKANFGNIRQITQDVFGTLKSAFSTFKSTVIDPFVSGFQSAFDNQLNTVLSEFAETGQMVIDTLSNLTGGGVGDISGQMESVGETVGTAANSLQDFLIALNNIAQGQQSLPDLSLSLSLSQIGQAPRSIQNLADSVRDLGREFAETGQILFNFGNQVFAIVQKTLKNNRQTFINFGKAVTNALSGIIDVMGVLQRAINYVLKTITLPVLMGLLKLISNQLGPTIDELTETINTYARALRLWGEQAGRIWSKYGDQVKTVAQFVADFIEITLVTALDLLLSTIRVILNVIQGDFGEAWEELVNLFERFVDRITEFVKEWNFPTIIRNVVDAIRTTFATFFTETLPQMVVVGLGQAVGTAETLGKQLFNALAGALNSLARAVDTTFTGIANSIITAINNVISEAQSLIQAAPKEIREQLPEGITNIEQLETLATGQTVQPVDPMTINPRETQERAVANIAASLELDVTGDGPLADFIDKETELKLQQRERRADRLRDRGTGF